MLLHRLRTFVSDCANSNRQTMLLDLIELGAYCIVSYFVQVHGGPLSSGVSHCVCKHSKQIIAAPYRNAYMWHSIDRCHQSFPFKCLIDCRMTNVFVIGKGDKPLISLPKGKGIRLNILQEQAKIYGNA